ATMKIKLCRGVVTHLGECPREDLAAGSHLRPVLSLHTYSVIQQLIDQINSFLWLITVDQTASQLQLHRLFFERSELQLLLFLNRCFCQLNCLSRASLFGCNIAAAQPQSRNTAEIAPSLRQLDGPDQMRIRVCVAAHRAQEDGFALHKQLELW